MEYLKEKISKPISVHVDYPYFWPVYRDLIFSGKEVFPRGLKCKELENYSYELPPYVRFSNFKARKINLDYIKKEFLWYLTGDKFDTSICQFASMWSKLINKDGTINSNYGQYIFTDFKQFNRCFELLKNDKDSRRAAIVILRAEHVLSDTPDECCTYSISFRIRDNKLNMSVRMRSQDSVLGLSNDAAAFSFIHEMMYVKLREVYNYLELGTYHHTCDSFHVYEKHFKMLDDIQKEMLWSTDKALPITCPLIYNSLEVDDLISGSYTKQSCDIPKNYLFTRWLLNKFDVSKNYIIRFYDSSNYIWADITEPISYFEAFSKYLNCTENCRVGINPIQDHYSLEVIE